jgi:hypothetical protein
MTNNNNIRDSASRHSGEWKMAWNAVARLAAARQDVLRGARHDDPPVEPLDSAGSANASAQPVAPVDADEYARAIAEIEQASAALRRAEPGLEAWKPEAASEPRKSWPVWILVSGIWISTVTVFAGAIGAILYWFG